MRFSLIPSLVVLLAIRGGVVAATPEKAVIRTPQPSFQPRINGAMVFGVRPGHPFLYTIAASGRRPMEFAADGLPEGLKLDAASGRMSGAVGRPGDYSVILRARNALGAAERKFRIVVGDRLALTPHMGWNSWYIWGSGVTDKTMRDAADTMITSGMINHGYTYVNIDAGWAVRPGDKNPDFAGQPRDAQGNINPNRRFPDMKALTDYIHHRGLKAGIYCGPGPVECCGCVGSYQHEAQDARRFADWGFDFLKYDWCSYDSVAGKKTLANLQKPYALMWGELKKQNRDIVFNLCQYGMGDVWKWGATVGNSWRTAGDLGLTHQGIPAAVFRDGLDLYAKGQLHKFGGPGGWNDPDYLLLGWLSGGRTTLTPNEQYTHVTFWSLVAAPLIFSGDMMRLDDFTLNLLSNDEVIDVDQDPLGRPGYRVAKLGGLEVWARDLEDGSKAVGLFNRGETESAVTAKWSDLGVQGKQLVRDCWRQKDLGQFDGQFTINVARHGAELLRLTPVK
jgi:alpha-galactosidase